MEKDYAIVLFYVILISATLTALVAESYFKDLTPSFKLKLRRIYMLTVTATCGASFDDALTQHRPIQATLCAFFIGVIVLSAFASLFDKEKPKNKGDEA